MPSIVHVLEKENKTIKQQNNYTSSQEITRRWLRTQTCGVMTQPPHRRPNEAGIFVIGCDRHFRPVLLHQHRQHTRSNQLIVVSQLSVFQSGPPLSLVFTCSPRSFCKHPVPGSPLRQRAVLSVPRHSNITLADSCFADSLTHSERMSPALCIYCLLLAASDLWPGLLFILSQQWQWFQILCYLYKRITEEKGFRKAIPWWEFLNGKGVRSDNTENRKWDREIDK